MGIVFLATLAFSLMSPQGIAPDWDLKPKALLVAEGAEPLRPLLDQLDPAKWEVPGGSDLYVLQLKEAQQALKDIGNVSARLAETPSRLTVALEALLRMEYLVARVQSLSEGVRRYQNPAIAEVIESVLVKAASSRDWLRAHVTEVAAVREKELAVAEKEAQLCREQTQRQTRGRK